MDKTYAPLFEKGNINGLELKNRLVMSPMGAGFTDTDGRMSERSIAYFGQRAKGGAGMILTEAMMAYRTSGFGAAAHFVGDATCLPRLTEFTDLLHGYGTKACAQIGAGLGRMEIITPQMPNPWAASAIPAYYDPNVPCHEMTVDEIQNWVDLIGIAAKRMVVAGFDAIEIHAHAGYLIDQFMSRDWNFRADQYGGSLENRMRYATDIIKAIRQNTGPNFPIIFRTGADHKYPGGRTIDEAIEMAKILESAGVDALDIDAGCYGPSFYWQIPPAYLGDTPVLDVATAIKKAVAIPVLNSGHYTPETALKAIKEGAVDFIMLGRPLLADADLPNKLKEGKREDIRPCIRCNENCVNLNLFQQKGLSCGVNVMTGHERTYHIRQSEVKKKVVVVGGGPAGLEAARVAALKGHDVTIYEKSDHTGGKAAVAATPEFKTIGSLLTWFDIQLKKLGVKVVLNTEITASSPELKKADHIFVGLGSNALIPPIEGMDLPIRVDVCNAHLKPWMIKGNDVVVCGGGLSGADSALEMAMAGKDVTIIETRQGIGLDTAFINTMAIMDKFKQYNVKVLVNTTVKTITGDGVVVTDREGAEKVIPADTVVTAFGAIANREPAEKIQQAYPDAIIIGDCGTIGRIGTAIHDGFKRAYAV